MNRQATLIMLGLASLSGSGCAQSIDYRLSPPAETQWVNVEIKNPSQYTRPFPLEVLYISHVCKRKLMSMRDGKHYEKVGHNPIKVELEAQGNDIWRAKVAMTGGGACEWRLSEFNLGIEYIEAKHLGNDLVPGTAVGATIAFDNIAAQNGQFEEIQGSHLNLSPQYYPLIKTNKSIHKIDTLNLFGHKNFLQKKLNGPFNIINISYTPKLDESKVVKMVAPKEYKVGDFYKIIYPDGTIISDGSTHPDIKRLME